MIMRMFALKDRSMGLFMNPMCLNSRMQAIRVVSDEVNRVGEPGEQRTTLRTHPEDISLYEIAEFDTESGIVSAPSEPTLVAECKDMVIGRQ